MELHHHDHHLRPARVATAILVVAILLSLNWVVNIARRDFVTPPPLVVEPSATPIAKGQQYTLLAGEVAVGVDVIKDEFWVGRIVVRGPKAEYASESYGYDSERQSKDEFVNGLRAQTGWKDGVLFVPHSCGGGNAWRCNLQLLYRVNDGRLIELGSVEAGAEGQPVGTSLVGGLIEDSFDLLEDNSLTSHAAAPWFTIVLRVTPERLVVDSDLTWEKNLADFNDNEARLSCEGAGCEPIIDPEERAGMALHDAALAKYCGRDSELAVAMALAERTLDEEAFKAFKMELSAVHPGELMSPFIQEGVAETASRAR